MNQSKLLKKFAIFMVCTTGLAYSLASATPLSFDLTSTSSLPSNTVLGTVTLTQISTSEVDVSVVLTDGAYFVKSGVGEAFDFNLQSIYGTSATTVAFLDAYGSNNFTINPYVAPGNTSNSYNLTPDGVFTNSISLIGNGSSTQTAGPLNFKVTTTLAGGIGFDAFALPSGPKLNPNGTPSNGQPGGYEFGADLFYAGSTGSAAYLDNGSGGGTGDKVPEPGTLALMGLGIAGLASLRKRNKAS
jgi:hypothetical protein